MLFVITTEVSHRCIAVCCAALLASCAGYQALPLEGGAAPKPLQQLAVDAASLPFPALAAHRFDPTDGLDLTEAAMLAVVNNPDLRLARDDAGIAGAQAFAAGLLPEPQISLARDLSNTASGPGATRASSFGLSYDVAALLAHAALSGAARADAGKVQLTLLWQEWQTASQAQLLFVKVQQGRRLLAVLQETRQLFALRVTKVQQALARGLLASDVITPHLVALQDIDRQLFEQQRLLHQATYDLNVLLGLPPATELSLQASALPARVTPVLFDAALRDMAQRRPDLRALQQGYGAEDQRYRAALLAQFPTLNLGLSRSLDASNVAATGLTVGFSLPVFNRNRGNIAIELATRRKLFDEYQLRLQAARNDGQRLLAEQGRNSARAASIDAELVALQAALEKSALAFRTGNVDVLLYTNAHAALLAKQLERISLQQSAMEQQIALRTVLGVDLNQFESPH
jgi:outer membrane protein TolC